ncbi:MAG: type II secretion system F family protein [Acidobacteriota bacterium]
MLAGLLTLLLFTLVTSAIAFYGYRYYSRPGRIMEQVGPAAVALHEHADGPAEHPSGSIVRIIRQIGEKVPISPKDASVARRYLIAAGFREEHALLTYYGLKVVLCAGMVTAAFLLRNHISSMPVYRIPFIAAAALAGYFGPNLVLERLVGRRQERLRFALPDALDLMVVSVEAGLGLDQAIQSVSRELGITHKDLCDELSLVTLEMRAGKRRSEALRNLADRTGQAEIRQLVAVLVQTDKFGTSMAESLRTHSDFLRVRRRQEAEERANKIGVKLVFPIFFCILPSMFVVAGGPAILQILKHLLPLMRQTNQ